MRLDKCPRSKTNFLIIDKREVYFDQKTLSHKYDVSNNVQLGKFRKTLIGFISNWNNPSIVIFCYQSV